MVSTETWSTPSAHGLTRYRAQSRFRPYVLAWLLQGMSAVVSRDVELKERALRDVLRSCESVVIGFSGGVDSSFLANAALDELGRDRVLAVTGRSPSYPEVQHEMALNVARSVDLPHLDMRLA